MEQSSGIGARTPSDLPIHPSATAKAATPQRDRRREKPQLSCTFCRRRKMRCDRQLPCQSCISKGIELTCSYPPAPQSQGVNSVGDRIRQLEALIQSLAPRQQTSLPIVGAVGEDNESSLPGSINGGLVQLTSTSVTSVSTSESQDGGSAQVHWHGEKYVSSVHWAAVLDSISELKDQYEKEEEARMQPATNDFIPYYTPGPRLLYEPVQASRQEILASIPERPVVDRLVARYFNAQGLAPAILHSGQFLREYEMFWQNQNDTPFTWIGLLFSILCLSTQYQQLAEGSADHQLLTSLYLFRERTINCLALGQFTRGGPHVLETLILSCATEALLSKDAEMGPWLLLGTLVQLALSSGYHREPRNSNISVFSCEMRRRVWAVIVQMDLKLSSQIGLPRLLNTYQCDTAEPRNLLDSDFDETTEELPPSRPETEITPVLYGLAKNRIDRVGGLISDLISDIRDHPYSEIMDLDRKLHDAEDSLPAIFRWQPLSQSFMVAPHVIMHRVWLRLAVQRLLISLHRKYLAPTSVDEVELFEYSRRVCVEAAIQILETQKLVDEETQIGGQLESVRWIQTSLAQSCYLLGMSVLCYYLQLVKRASPPLPEDCEGTKARIHDLLHVTYPMWLRSSTVSREARRAVEHLSLLFGLRSGTSTCSLQEDEMTSCLSAEQNIAMSIDPVTWDAYQECIANLPEVLYEQILTPDVTGPISLETPRVHNALS